MSSLMARGQTIFLDASVEPYFITLLFDTLYSTHTDNLKLGNPLGRGSSEQLAHNVELLLSRNSKRQFGGLDVRPVIAVNAKYRLHQAEEGAEEEKH